MPVAARALPPETTASHAAHLATLEGEAQLEAALHGAWSGRIALVSSFGAEAAVLLHLVARIDRTTPVLLLDTLKLFPETLAYRHSLARHLGLTNIIDLKPMGAAAADPDGTLWSHDPDACCALRKVAPLDTALQGFTGWINGRKRHHGEDRTALPTAEVDDRGRLKLTPLANWTPELIADHMTTHALPRHPLLAQGYRSIGCQPCTAPVGTAASPRAGRWLGQAKTECGIHNRTPKP